MSAARRTGELPATTSGAAEAKATMPAAPKGLGMEVFGAGVEGALAPEQAPQSPTPEELRDLGFGSRVAQLSRQRLLNRDGSFNVFRRGLSFVGQLDAFHALLTISWPRFFALSFAFYIGINALFAGAFALCGPQALRGVAAAGFLARLPRAFFFSVETFTTIGYGNIVPTSTAAELLMTVEAFVGLLTIALVTGLLFARFSRPAAAIAFSRRAVVAPYRGGAALMFRMINQRRGELSSVAARVVLALSEERRGIRARRFFNLALERSEVAFFPLAWTVVHPIDEQSPLWGLGSGDLAARGAEVLVLVTAIDDAFSRTTQARTSYSDDEIACGARFADMFEPTGGSLAVDVRKLDEIEPAELPARH